MTCLMSGTGTISRGEIEKTYKISRRVEAEERGLDSAVMVFTSTQQEIDEQWGLYEGCGSPVECDVHSTPTTGLGSVTHLILVTYAQRTWLQNNVVVQHLVF